MAKYEIISPGYLGRSSDVNAARCVNLYPELNTVDSKSAGSLVGTPGLLLFIDTLLGPIRGLHFFNNLIYFISGNKLYSVDAAANIFPIIDAGSGNQVSLATFTGSISMADNGMAPTGGSQLAVADGQNLLIYNVTSGATTGIGYPSKTVVYFSNYFVADIGGMGYDVSAIRNGSVVGPASGGWQDLHVSTADAYPSNLIAVVNNHMELWFIKEYSTEVWDITGSASPLFARQCVIDYGTNAPHSVAKGNNTIFFLVSTRNGDNGTVAGIGMADGYGMKIVSSQMINNQLTKYAITSDAFGYCYTDAGHEFYVLTFPSENATWVYDATTKMLHERSYYQGSPYIIGRHLSNCYVYAWGKHFVGSYLDGKLYQMSESFYDDDGVPIASLRVGPPTEDKRNNDYVFFSKMQLDAEMGVGDGSGLSLSTNSVTGGPNPGAVLSAAGFAWVATEGGILKFGTTSESQLAFIATVGNCVFMAYDGKNIWSRLNDSNFAVIDPATNAVSYPFVSLINTNEVIYAFGSIWLTVAGLTGTKVLRIDPATKAIISTINFVAPFTQPYSLIASNKYIWVTNYGVPGNIFKIDPTTNTIIGTIPGFNLPASIVWDGNYLWVANYQGGYGDNTVFKVDENSMAIILTVVVGAYNSQPIKLFYDSITSSIWGTNNAEGTIFQISPDTTGGVFNTVSGLAYPAAIGISGNADNYTLWVCSSNLITSYNWVKSYSSNPTGLLSWSDDGGHTWSNDHPASLGVMGNYKNRAIWRRLGASRNRIFRIAISDPVKKVLIGAYMDLEGAE